MTQFAPDQHVTAHQQAEAKQTGDPEREVLAAQACFPLDGALAQQIVLHGDHLGAGHIDRFHRLAAPAVHVLRIKCGHAQLAALVDALLSDGQLGVDSPGELVSAAFLQGVVRHQPAQRAQLTGQRLDGALVGWQEILPAGGAEPPLAALGGLYAQENMFDGLNDLRGVRHPVVARQKPEILPARETDHPQEQRQQQRESPGKTAFGRRAPPQRQLEGGLLRQRAEFVQLPGGQPARHGVRHAERSQRVTLRRP